MEDEERVFAAEEFDKLILELAEAALKKKFQNLSKNDRADIESDRAAIERGVRHLKHGLALRSSNDPEVLRDSGWLLMVGACAICSRANASDIVKKYLDVESHGSAGQMSGVSRREDMAEWQAKALTWRDERITKNPPAKHLAEARACKKDIALPISERRLAEFFSQESKRRKHANKVVPIRA